MKPIVITPGEPAGIGPDIVLPLARHKIPSPLVIIGDPDLFSTRAKLLGLSAHFPEYDPAATKHPPISIQSIPLKTTCVPGNPMTANADYVMESIQVAVAGCLHHNFSALVTGPVNKAIMNDAGMDFSGHTELLATLTRSPKPVMLMVCEKLRVALLTTHIPLAEVPKAITRDNLLHSIRVIHQELKNKFRISKPRILVCGLNPHAGEGGYLGLEERNIIKPAIDELIHQGLDIEGPVSADTAFTPSRLQHADVILAMYHDQGLPVIKAQHFGEVVNVTLGLPIIRCSVDHGTAFDLAGTGKADEHSLLSAIHLAIKLAHG